MPGSPPRHAATGIAFAAAAYVSWGVFPLYFRQLAAVPAVEILAHRILWSAVFMAALVTALRRWGDAREALRRPGTLPTLTATALLISANWLTYIWAVNAGHVLEASLGYFVNPLVTVLLGVAFLRETLTRPQKVAIALAAAGVVALVVRAGTVPWIALALAVTFGLYGLLRKRLRVDAVTGLLGEVGVLAPVALLFLGWRASRGQLHLGPAPRETLFLLSSGVVTALPLLWFAAGVRRLRLATVGVLQYLNPTMQFAIAVFAFREPFGAAHGLAFGCIWASLAIYTADAVASARAAP
ncbi:MAG TPA: EamA family transporter RarD [Anaeromyxobacteraceae bacterium]|nr:EamA family transporter RarD [Anaeromyxobacteraceae bacterium]